MLSSFSSFLPSVLQNSAETTAKTAAYEEEDEDDSKQMDTVSLADNDVAIRKKDKKDKNPNETFIFVRPPPSKTNHPLNLQVQLVPPNSRAPGVPGSGPSSSRAPSVDFSSSEDQQQHFQHGTESSTGTTLTRVSSNRSEASTYSGYGSTTSFSSVASVGSTASGRRMIIPLYNLQAHNVMTNVIVDAGTDAKIARFIKRGLELIDLAILEPIEVWPSTGGNNTGTSGQNVLRATAKESGDVPQTANRNSFLLPNPGGSSSRPGTPEGARTPEGLRTPASSSRLSLSSSGHHTNDHFLSQDPDMTPMPTPQPSTPKRNLFGKFFKKKESAPPPPSSSPTPTAQTPTPASSELVSKKRSSLSLAPASLASLGLRPTTSNLSQNSTGDPSTPTNGTMNTTAANGNVLVPPSPTPSGTMLRPPVLGIQPTLSAPSYPPTGRPAMYVWHVRRWLKGGEGGLLGGMMGKLALNASGGNAGMVAVDVRFEWKRGKTSGGKGRREGRGKSKATGMDRTSRDVSAAPSSANASRRQSVALPTDSTNSLTDRSVTGGGGLDPSSGMDEKERKKTNRLSALSQKSGSTSVTGNDFKTEEGADDGGDESDPEDSETPWTCALKVRKLVNRRSNNNNANPNEEKECQPIKLKVGTLSPTPHHPKVVSMLKVPFPLPDVDVDRVSLRKRTVLPNGSVNRAPSGSAHGEGGLELTAEEIKDIVCSTGMWLVVREGFGGVGKVSRKGDGWRIRA